MCQLISSCSKIVGLTPCAKNVCTSHDHVTETVPEDPQFSEVLPGLRHPVGTEFQEPQLHR